ncbi:hypothetical protein M404DRAFT_264625 [Pisolithus tinctorius Marx 270]|uniref:Uncharacterized protein n=1 Tax=Pisolithus tinctorius Marx 270 TaxID=870435 RepID=A0A0C3PM77_PISTI|nr:hypothetical protein M404DRAFT_264625 [Pisolithus tinctorius Marx 270]
MCTWFSNRLPACIGTQYFWWERRERFCRGQREIANVGNKRRPTTVVRSNDRPSEITLTVTRMLTRYIAHD